MKFKSYYFDLLKELSEKNFLIFEKNLIDIIKNGRNLFFDFILKKKIFRQKEFSFNLT